MGVDVADRDQANEERVPAPEVIPQPTSTAVRVVSAEPQPFSLEGLLLLRFGRRRSRRHRHPDLCEDGIGGGQVPRRTGSCAALVFGGDPRGRSLERRVVPEMVGRSGIGPKWVSPKLLPVGDRPRRHQSTHTPHRGRSTHRGSRLLPEPIGSFCPGETPERFPARSPSSPSSIKDLPVRPRSPGWSPGVRTSNGAGSSGSHRDRSPGRVFNRSWWWYSSCSSAPQWR